MDLYYREYGDRDASLIVFLHGGGVSSWMWDKQVQYLTNYHCVTVDLPEQGQSAQKDEFSIENSAYRIIELINELANGKDVIVIGFSLGAQILVQMLSYRSDLINYAIINSALVKPNRLGEKVISPLIRLTFPLIKNRTFSQLQAKTLFIGEEHFERYYNESCQMERKTLVRILKENMSFEIPAEFSEAKGKILVTVGDKEKAVMKKSASEIVNCNENCTGVIISKIGHGVPLSKPDLFNQIIEKWINGEKLPEECKEIV
ncbi:alpha/beta fold hydrolase [Bacillus sp. Hm123]|uniref:alpha/beta fold hydrolase n=1 Tax=Bacillus sp. Hm123 TaxID=3450745 RepID=UPI003F433629